MQWGHKRKVNIFFGWKGSRLSAYQVLLFFKSLSEVWHRHKTIKQCLSPSSHLFIAYSFEELACFPRSEKTGKFLKVAEIMAGRGFLKLLLLALICSQSKFLYFEIIIALHALRASCFNYTNPSPKKKRGLLFGRRNFSVSPLHSLWARPLARSESFTSFFTWLVNTRNRSNFIQK